MVYIGIDLGGTNIAVGVCDENLKIIVKGSVPTNPDRAPELIVKDMADLSAKLLKDSGFSIEDVASVGIATPGTANSDTGVVEYSNNIPFLRFPIADVFKSYLPVKRVLIENDANAAALAEALSGAAKGTKKSVMITLGTGVGGGIVIDGKVYSGFNHAGGELGHIVIEKGGRPCSCGRRGCWEAYSSATGLVNMTREKVNECKIKGIPSLMVDEFDQTGRVSARTAFAAMKKGDKAGSEVVNEYVDYLACGLTNIINVFQPEVFCIGGGLAGAGEQIMAPVRQTVEREVYAGENDTRTRIVRATLGNDAGLIGAAMLPRFRR